MSIDPQTLLDWFDANARDLPWRHADCTPWGVLVSEIMLQQTPVARVLPVWRQWMERWPKPADLAAASQGEVLRAWGKLGYPRRALRLHTAANTIVAEHGGEVPADVDTLLSLPGIGAYTARAVAAFAYGRRAPVVDTNVRRVVARAVHGAAEAGPPSTKRDLDDVEALLPDGPDEARAARFSAALMELGALVPIVRHLRLAEGGPTCVYGPHQAHATLQRHRPTRAWSATRRAPWHHRSGGEGTARSRLAEGGTTRRVPGLVAQ